MIQIKVTKQQKELISEYAKFKRMDLSDIMLKAIYDMMREENYYLLDK